MNFLGGFWTNISTDSAQIVGYTKIWGTVFPCPSSYGYVIEAKIQQWPVGAKPSRALYFPLRGNNYQIFNAAMEVFLSMTRKLKAIF